ncbi:MAG: FAD-dependent oxidoreductase, partial [Spirosomataceae bacterium]
STTDRRPFLGKHPEFNNMFIFNGLGTKGVSIAPFFARQFRDFLLNGKEINSETTIERFYTLY